MCGFVWIVCCIGKCYYGVDVVVDYVGLVDVEFGEYSVDVIGLCVFVVVVFGV